MKTRTWICWILLIALAAGLAFGYVHRHNPNARTVEIVLDGKVLKTIDLSQVSVPYTLTIEDHKGGYNVLLVEPSRICVSQANCPDQICVSQGWLYDQPAPIVCLPHGLVIRVISDTPLDGVAQ